MDLAAISAALCDQLSSIDNVRVYDGYQDAVFTGTGIAVVVRPADDWVDYLRAMSGGLSGVKYVIELVVQHSNLRSAYARICELVSAGVGNNRSIIDTLKPDSLPQSLGGVIDDLKVSAASGMREKVFGPFSYIGVDIDVEVSTTRLHS